jgi:arylsulfatase A-like enzyme
MTRPNIIFILLDDFGWRDLACYGSSFYQTPNLDALCARSMRFTDAYASCPVCSPTRASVLTGKYPARVGVTNFIDWAGRSHPARGRLIDVPYQKELPRTETSLATTLGDGGYATWHVGKWHLGGPGFYPQDHGFEENVGGCEVGSPGSSGYFSPWSSIPALADADVPEGTYLTDYLTDRALGLIENRDRRRPFFLNLWYYTVHTPIQAKQEKIARHTARAEELGLDRVETFEEGDFFPCEHKRDGRIRRRLVQSDPVYAAMVESMDECVGRILQGLNEEGIADETVIVFTSDNGGLATSEGSPTCNAPLAEGKGWMYEGGTREPLVVNWPGITAPGSECRVPVTSTDFYPTFLEMAGLDPMPDQHGDGVSLAPLLKGAPSLDREAIFWHYPHYGNQGGTPGSSVRAGDFKLIEFFEDRHVELYNLRSDIGEETDLALELPEVTARLRVLLAEWRTSIEARIPQPNPDFTPWREREISGRRA